MARLAVFVVIIKLWCALLYCVRLETESSKKIEQANNVAAFDFTACGINLHELIGQLQPSN